MKNNITFENQHISPSKIVCVGRNYVEHIQELGNAIPSEPVIFCKPNSALSTDLCTHPIDDIHYEGEISFIIHNGVITGVGFGLDLTKRKIQSSLKEQSLPWERAKAFDKSAVFSHFVKVGQNLSELRTELFINGQLKQSSGYPFMLNKPEALVREISSFMTLEDGDVVMSGTPAGVGQVHAGDHFVGKIYDGHELLLEHSWSVQNLK